MLVEPVASVQAGQTFSLSVEAVDASGNLDPDFGGSVALAVAGNTLGGANPVTAIGGVANFTGLTLKTVGQYTLAASNSALGSATTSSITVTPGAASKLIAVTDPSGSLTAGVPFGFEVEATDAEGNLVTGFTGNVTAALSPNTGNATVSGSISAVASGGVAQFSGLTVDQAGSNYTIQAASTGLTNGTTTSFNVVAAGPAQLAISPQPPGSITAGSPFGFTVAIEDTFGNPVSSFVGGVTIELAGGPSGGALGGSLTVPVSSGLAAFSNLALDTAGSGYTIQATAPGLNPATTNSINVVAGLASKLAVQIPPPTTMVAGFGFGLAFMTEDAFGNLATDFTGNVTISLPTDPGATTLNGPLTVKVTNGVANTHDLYTLDKAAAGYVIEAIAVNPATGKPFLAPVTTHSISVTPEAATHLAVVTQPPSNVALGAGFAFSVAAEDPFGNVDPTYVGQVTVAPPAGSGAVLGGTATIAAGKGAVSFAGLTLSNATAPVSLVVSGAGLAGTTTNPVNLVTAARIQFSAGSLNVNEDAGTATFQIVRTGGLPGALSVNVATSGGTAVPGVNYTAINQTVTFPSGHDTATVTVPVINAGLIASGLNVNVILSSPGGGAVLASPSTATLNILNVGQSANGAVTMDSIQVIKNKAHQVKEIIIGFSGALNATEAASVAEYSLTQAGKKGSFTVKSAKKIKLLSAVYNPLNDTVALTPKKKFAITKPVQLMVNGLPPAGLEDASGRLIDGNHDGQPGGNAVALIKVKTATITSVSLGSAVVDALLEQGELVAMAKARKK